MKANRRTGSMSRIFKLKNSWAADHKVGGDGNTITVRGVATVLSNMDHVKKGDANEGLARRRSRRKCSACRR
ncbi:hypothetical protein [Paraburkholderia sp.]|uniref:hypothetical protein n=1 Tax=Paraburkholderia sp. TaxID=1926495 RepID=UPI003C7CF0DD